MPAVTCGVAGDWFYDKESDTLSGSSEGWLQDVGFYPLVGQAQGLAMAVGLRAKAEYRESPASGHLDSRDPLARSVPQKRVVYVVAVQLESDRHT